MRGLMLWCLGLAVIVTGCLGLDNGLGRTPPMGWNSWNHFNCGINETLIRRTADLMVSSGLKDLGYEYVNMDDCWQASRTSSGRIVEDTQAFPSGIRALSDYIHSQGLKFGLYSDAGLFTCQGRPGSLGHEELDAQVYAEFQVDFLKYDNCFNAGETPKQRYPAMSTALNKTGRYIFFAMCEWGVDDPATWAPALANSWRTTTDIENAWESVLEKMDENNRWWKQAGPGAWNDPDMLEIGNGNLSIAEERSHFTLWAAMKAPLILGFDLASVSQDSLDIVSNQEIIAINQDALGVQAHRVQKEGDLEVWAGPLQGNEWVVVLFNRSPQASKITARWSDIGITSGPKLMHVRDLWAHQSRHIATSSVSAVVPPHDVVALRLSSVLHATE